MELSVNASTFSIPFPFAFPITFTPLRLGLGLRLRGMALGLSQIEAIWRLVRRKAIAPLLRLALIVCLAMSVLLLIDIAAMGAISLAVKFLRRRPDKRYKWEPITITISADLEQASLAFPTVLVQIPMYNEKEVYKLSIGAACGLSWPSDRIFIQVLDDSTDPTVKDLVQLECKIWASKGKNIFYEVRDNRKGYKAGALKKGMEYSYAQKCDFVAIFDADFQPESDFLMRTIPFLMHNPKIGLVQARWQFVNPNECLMTRIQRMTLDYHFKVEQEAGSSVFSFFGFNGTAGVWRISAINEAGGWKDRTTVEDMDLAVRACLKGWQFVYVGDVKVKSELPSTLKAYRNQQHRWTCGGANLLRKMSKEILATREVSIWRKVYLLYSFFFVRKVVAHLVTFFLYCVVVPVSVLVPEVSVPVWGVAYIPTTITLLNAIRNPRLIHFIPFWILFENVMSMHRMKATLIGLFETGRVNEWVVTEKLGEAVSTKPEPQILEKPSFRLRARIKLSEIGFAVFLFFCACCDLFYGGNYYFVYIYLQSISFLVVGLGYVGKYVSNS
ncbi:cellulose synthase like [Rhynchospora pubera]|uniref:glucomannan 4-beta-mannosyltransferase n=1 Tax=Rhynchospora pubera TaxID=906938 RepID=A0AAV8CML0_9POAL|nr:cellulose synthase like [Rhynchospora pubera]